MTKPIKIAALFMFALSAIPVLAQEKAVFNKEAFINAQEQAVTNTYLRSDYTDSLSMEARVAGLSLLWSEAKYNFANFDLVSLNLDSLYKAFIPRVVAAKSTLQYYKELKAFYAYLRDGHSGVAYPKELWPQTQASTGVVTEIIEGKVIITGALPGVTLPGPIAPGDEIVGLNGQLIGDYISQQLAPYTSFSTPQDSIARILRFELFAGDIHQPVQLKLKNKKEQVYTATLNRRPPLGLFETGQSLGEFRMLDKNIAYIALNTFNDPAIVSFFEKHFDQINKANGLIIDVRNNGGGNGQNGFEILGQLTDKPFMQSATLYRKYNPTAKAWNDGIFEVEEVAYDWKPYKERIFTKPVVLLIGPSTYSAAEDFTNAFRQAKRGLIMGEPTGGSTGQPLMFPIPGGGMAWVCSKRDYSTDGTDFVGQGILPDLEIKRSLLALRKGKDNVVDEAWKQLQQRK